MLATLPVPTLLSPGETRWDHADPEWEMQFWPRVMWGDMGTFSGVSVIWFDPKVLFDPRQPSERSAIAWWSSYLSGNENGQAREMLRLARGLGGPEGLAVGLEKFVVKSVHSEETFLSSPRIAAKVDFGLWSGIRDHDDTVRRRTALWQYPSEIDYSQNGDNRLKMLEMYVGGADHRNDATKHALLHLKKMSGGGLHNFQTIYGWLPEWGQD